MEPLGSIDSFDTSEDGEDTYLDAVAVIGTGGRLHRAAISERSGWPVFVGGSRDVRFPGYGETATDLAMAAGPNGSLHAVWISQRALYYARVDGGSYAGEAVVLREDEAMRPNLAVRADGQVFIAYVEGWHSRTPNMRPKALRGSIEDGFLEVPLNTGCCRSYDRGAWDVVIGDIRFDATGDVHLVYGWRVDAPYVDYVTGLDSRAPRVERFSEQAAMVGPGLLLHPNGYDVLFLDEGYGAVKLREVRDDRRAPSTRIIFEAPDLRKALLTRDPTGGRHVVVESEPGGRASIEYLSVESGDTARVRAVGRAWDRSYKITPRAGGVAWSAAGLMYVPYREVAADRWPGYGRFGLAVGRALTP